MHKRSRNIILGLVIFTLAIVSIRASVSFGALTFGGTSVSGDSSLTIDNSGSFTLGGTNATTIAIGRSGVTTTVTGAVIFANITGSTQCLHVNASGTVSGTGSDCGTGGSGFTNANASSGIAVATSTTMISIQNVGVTSLMTATGSLAFATSGPLLSNITQSGPTITFTSIPTSTILTGYSTTTGANPSVTIGLSAVNGAANTFLRSDGAPALSQAIIPTWTGLHTFNGGLTAAATSTFASSTVFSSITGSTQCLHVNASGTVSGTGSDCGAGGGVTGTSTSTFIAVWSGASTVAGYSTLAYTSSTDTLSIGTSTIVNLKVSTSLQAPTSTAPASAGQIGVKTSTSTLNFSDGTAERVLDPVRGPVQFVIENPTASENDGFWIANATGTITAVYAVNKTAGDTVTFNIRHNASFAGTTSDLFASDQAVTATTTAQLLTTFASSTFNSGEIFRFRTSAASSTQFVISVYYRENP